MRRPLSRLAAFVVIAFSLAALIATLAIPARGQPTPRTLDQEIDSLIRAAPRDYEGVVRRLRQLQRDRLDSIGRLQEQTKRKADSIAKLLFPLPLRIATGLIDQDPGGYPRSLIPQSDRWTALHVAGGCGTAMVVAALGWGSWESVVITVVASLAHEIAQGYVDPGDTVAELGGAVACLGISQVLRT